MRIAFIVGGFPLISETFILNQITGLMDLGHEVDIYARRSSPDRAVHPEVEKYGLLGRTRWFNLPLTRTAAVYRQLPKQGDIFLAICESWNRRKLLEFGFDARRIRLHPIGVDTRRISFKVREPRGAQLDILTVARLHPEKGIEHGLRAVANLSARRPRTEVRYRIVGAGEDRERLGTLVEELGLDHQVEFLGPLPTPDVLKWMDTSHIFLLPSLAEATPTVLLEAQATGLPILATDVGGVRDIVPSSAGFLVPAANPEALSDKLALLADHPEYWPAMGRAGRRFVEEHHDIADLDARLAALFEEVVFGTTESPV